MERPSYKRVAAAIAAANNDEERQAAAELLAQYNAVEPPLETTRERMAMLHKALVSALAAEAE